MSPLKSYREAMSSSTRLALGGGEFQFPVQVHRAETTGVLLIALALSPSGAGDVHSSNSVSR